MSQVIGQSAVMLAVSPVELLDFPFGEVVAKLANRQSANKSVKSQYTFNRQSLCDSVKNEVCRTYPQLFPKHHVDGETWDKIRSVVESFIVTAMKAVTADNIVKQRSAFAYDSKAGRTVMRHVQTAEDLLAIKEERFGTIMLRNEAEQRLAKLVRNMADADKIAAATRKFETLQAHVAQCDAVLAGK